MIDLSQRFLAASAIAREAGAVARIAFQSRTAESSVKFKGPQDYLTESDTRVELLIRNRLAEPFPDDGFLGEETGGAPDDSAATWVVDPIDGTANFARGIPHFCVALGLVLHDRTEIGVIYDPMMDELFACSRGKGAALNGAPIHVSNTADLHSATIEIGWSSRIAIAPYLELVRTVKEGGANVRRAGSGALALAYVAAGRNDGYCELHMNAWDAVAGLLLITEAGGHANDFLADDGLRSGNVVLGTNRQLAPVLADAIGLKAGD